VIAVGTCATYGGIHGMAGNPTGAMGVPDHLGWDWKSKAGPADRVRAGCPIHPDNLSETLVYLLYQLAGQAPMIPLDSELRPQVAVRLDRARGVRQGRLLRAGRLRRCLRLPKCIVKLG
jgi:hydrogenase small subunit